MNVFSVTAWSGEEYAARNPHLLNQVHTGNSVLIKAPREKIFAVVSDLARWPEHLPHYRFVRFIGEDGAGKIVHMAARRGVIPVSWVSRYEADPDTLELRFEHLRKWTKGMQVIWTLTPTRDGTRVEIIHDLRFRLRLLAWLAEPIIGSFITHIASRTLAEFKTILEKQNATL